MSRPADRTMFTPAGLLTNAPLLGWHEGCMHSQVSRQILSTLDATRRSTDSRYIWPSFPSCLFPTSRITKHRSKRQNKHHPQVDSPFRSAQLVLLQHLSLPQYLLSPHP